MPDKNKTIKYISTNEQLLNFLKKIKDLITIDNRIMFRIEKNRILVFSFVGDSFKNIHAFKNCIFSPDEIMTIKKGEIDDPIFFIIKDGKRFFKTIENLLDYEEIINCKMSINDENYVNFIEYDNSKLNIKIIGSDPMIIGSEISIEDIEYLMDTDKSLFNFKLDRIDFFKIKKMSLIDRIENDTKSPLYINISNNNLSIGETKWKLNVTEVNYENITLSFPKIYFNTINVNTFIDIYVFEEFILCKFDTYNLMILLETTI
jgi:hypothetical protein